MQGLELHVRKVASRPDVCFSELVIPGFAVSPALRRQPYQNSSASSMSNKCVIGYDVGRIVFSVLVMLAICVPH